MHLGFRGLAIALLAAGNGFVHAQSPSAAERISVADQANVQPKPVRPTFIQAVDAAYAIASSQRVADAQRSDWAARAAANQLRFAGSPELSAGHSSDALVGTGGRRMWELGISASLQPKALRAANHQLLLQEQAHWQREQDALRLKVQGELLELISQAELARFEVASATTRLTQWQALANEVDRRVSAGDAPRLDALLMHASVVQAKGVLQQVESALAALASQWRSKTDLMQWPPAPTLLKGNPAVAADWQADHAELAVSAAAWQLAQARVGVAQAERKEPPRYSIGATRERGAFGETAATTWSVGVSIPMQSDVRSQPKLSAALRDESAAEQFHRMNQRAVTELQAQAKLAFEAAGGLASALQQVATAQQEANALVQRAYKLGERDLQARIKSDGERIDAHAAAQRQLALTQMLRLKWLHAQGKLLTQAMIGEK